MSDNLFATVVQDLAVAETAKQYNEAKRKAGRLNTSAQFQVIDHLIACRRRLVVLGVL